MSEQVPRANRRSDQKLRNRLRLFSLLSIFFVYKVIDSYLDGSMAEFVIYTIFLVLYVFVLGYVYYVRYYKINKLD